MGKALLTNNAKGALTAGVLAGDLSFSITAGKGALFPNPTAGDYFYATITDAATSSVVEIVKVTARSTDTFTVVRAQQGTTALAWSSGDKVELRPTAYNFSELVATADIGSTVQAYDANTVKSNATKNFTAGYSATSYNAGTKSTGTFTPDESNGNFQYYINGGAHTLAPPTNDCTLVIQVTNNASAGTITTSGFTKVTGSTLTTTNTNKFFLYITKCNSVSLLSVQALQ